MDHGWLGVVMRTYAIAWVRVDNLLDITHPVEPPVIFSYG